MDILRTILNWRNPTRNWRLDPAKPLLLDLDTHRLSGVSIGDPLESLSFLGSASRWSWYLEFPNHGLSILGGPSVEELQFFFGHPAEKSGGWFRGTIVHRGSPIVLGGEDSEESLTARFGQAYWRDVDEYETLLFYEFPGRELQLEFGTDGRLKVLTIGLPILADPVQREAYRVSKPWPPG